MGGRPPKLTDDDIEAAKAMLANPDVGVTQIAHRLGVSPAMLYRYSGLEGDNHGSRRVNPLLGNERRRI